MDPVLKQAEVRLSEARAHLRVGAPYVAPALYALIPQAVRDDPVVKGTMGVSRGMVVYYDPDWLITKSPEEIAAALYHELMHLLRDHLLRMAMLPDLELGNISGDLAINPDLEFAGWKLPHGLFPEKYGLPKGQTLEWYYDAIQQKQQKQQQKPKPGPGSSQKGQGQPGQSGGGGGGDGHADMPGVGSGKCGGIAGNLPTELEQRLDEVASRSKAEQLAAVKETLHAIEAHAKVHGRGSVPSSLLEVVAASKEVSKIPWQAELKYVLKKATGRLESGGMDFSMARPSKRSHARGFPRPGMVQYQPEVAFILDTSGSMQKKQIQIVLVQMVAVFKAVGIDSAWFIQADAMVKETRKVRLRDILSSIDVKGRGGTDFDPAMRAADRLKPHPDLIIYLTDGDGFSSFRPKGSEVIWCIAPSHWNRRPAVPWGHLVLIGEDGQKVTAT